MDVGPALTTSFVLWAMYSGILLRRGDQDDAHRMPGWGRFWRLSACSTSPWWRWPLAGFAAPPHDAGNGASDGITLWIAIVGFTAPFALLLVLRRRQLRRRVRSIPWKHSPILDDEPSAATRRYSSC